jgi:hypothetical protein
MVASAFSVERVAVSVASITAIRLFASAWAATASRVAGVTRPGTDTWAGPRSFVNSESAFAILVSSTDGVAEYVAGLT